MLAAAMLALAGCSRPSGGAQQRRAEAEAYLSPPLLDSAVHAPGGGIRLAGSAPGGAEVRFRSPEGDQVSTKAAADGVWSLALPPMDSPRLYAFEAVVAGRTLKGEGALALMPSPVIAGLLLRSGYAALPPASGPSGRLELISFDYDGGGAAVAGFAPPATPVRFLIDGGMVGAGEANGQGRFAIVAVDPRRGVPPGQHLIRIETPKGPSLERRVEVSAPTLPPDRIYVAERGANGWLLSWRTPSGGVQTSLVFDPTLGGPPR